MTAVATDRLVAPHGGALVDRTGDRPGGIARLNRVRPTSRELSDLDMIASGALSPLEGFMGSDAYDRVLEEMRLGPGVAWTLPVCLAVTAPPRGDTVLLIDRFTRPLATLDVEEVYPYDKRREAQLCFGTTDAAHPGVARLYAQHDLYLAGRVTVFERPHLPFRELSLDPAETRGAFAARRWRSVVGFQTRNPIHRAHEYLTKAALETVDGLLIHPLLGETKHDDVPPEVRIDCYRALIDNYYPPERVLFSAFPAAMRYAGPREAVWHAICRQNFGCSHFIVGRDHAGVGGFYGKYDSQLIFEEFVPDELGIQPMFFMHVFWCRECEAVASSKTCPHGEELHVPLSGTRLRELVQAGEVPPSYVTRPEVADVLLASAHRPVSARREPSLPVGP